MLAIVIPYYKITFFKETLDSLARQTNKCFKVYIGDDASMDDPTGLFQEFQNSFSLKYKRFNKNLGSISLPRQWERCIEMTAGEEWIMLLGDDDVLGENVVDEWYKKFDAFNAKTSVVRFSSLLIEEDKNSAKIFYHPQWEDVHDFYERKHFYRTRSSLSEYIFRKKLYLKYGFQNYPLGWYSDDKAWFDFSECKQVYTINEATICIRISKESISGRKDLLTLKTLARVKFYRFLILKHFKYFTKPFRIILLRSYENSMLELDRFKTKDFLLLLVFYLRILNLKEIKKFFSRAYHRRIGR